MNLSQLESRMSKVLKGSWKLFSPFVKEKKNLNKRSQLCRLYEYFNKIKKINLHRSSQAHLCFHSAFLMTCRFISDLFRYWKYSCINSPGVENPVCSLSYLIQKFPMYDHGTQVKSLQGTEFWKAAGRRLLTTSCLPNMCHHHGRLAGWRLFHGTAGDEFVLRC